jgi:hypothetical protein
MKFSFAVWYLGAAFQAVGFAVVYLEAGWRGAALAGGGALILWGALAMAAASK